MWYGTGNNFGWQVKVGDLELMVFAFGTYDGCLCWNSRLED